MFKPHVWDDCGVFSNTARVEPEPEYNHWTSDQHHLVVKIMDTGQSNQLLLSEEDHARILLITLLVQIALEANLIYYMILGGGYRF